MKQLLWLITAALTMTVLDGFCCADDKREEKHRFKGVELYSWEDKEGGWVFVLVNGTNRLKTEKQVKGAKDLIRSTEAFRRRLLAWQLGSVFLRRIGSKDLSSPQKQRERKSTRQPKRQRSNFRLRRKTTESPDHTLNLTTAASFIRPRTERPRVALCAGHAELGTVAPVGRIDGRIGKPRCARRCRRTNARITTASSWCLSASVRCLGPIPTHSCPSLILGVAPP